MLNLLAGTWLAYLCREMTALILEIRINCLRTLEIAINHGKFVFVRKIH
ncbi:hypothetical protein CH06BL_11550 [Chromobacterium haemolyticum]|nr:hypothetical protein CH06BL_11550 [Chromobacterium haemolyticum]